ncbi:MAG: hypothetical protein RLY89_2207 [Bacteroidota bacterium]
MLRCKVSLFILFLLCMGNIQGQNSNGVEKILKQARELWKNEDFKESEKLYREAHSQSPCGSSLTELANKKFDIADIKGANKLFDENIQSLSRASASNCGLRQKDINYMLFNAYYEKININLQKGNPRTALLTGLELLNKHIDGFDNSFKLMASPNLGTLSESLLEVGFLSEDHATLDAYYTALKTYDKSERGQFFSQIYSLLLKNEVDEAIVIATKVAENGGDFFASKWCGNYMLTISHCVKGDFAKSEEYMNKAKKGTANNRFFATLDGRNAMLKKQFKEAVSLFTSALKPRKFLWYNIDPIDQFSTYTYRAKAYEGLGDVTKAKQDYEAALVYYPDYEPAVLGLARLQGKVISERRSDKTPPEISITEPSALTRGLKITAKGTDIMIKGIAKDSFGLKSVLINNSPAYAKEEGDFWGNISLKEGTNTVVIKAIDMAGNVATKTIEIEQPPATVAVKEDEIIAVKDGQNYALFIASQNYDDPSIPSLENPVTDAVKLKLVLKKNYGFKEDNLFLLNNPEKSNFRQQFQQLSEVLQPEDNLIIFYAGHGIWVEKEKKGYWLLTDAKRNDTETWVSNKDVLNMIAKLPTRHTLLITDACFSGGVFKTRSIGKDAPASIVSMNEKISRVAITSGNDTEVPDESVFMKYLIKALSENKEKYLTAQKMFITQIIEAVMTETKTEPRYGTLELAGHVGGDFIFTKK